MANSGKNNGIDDFLHVKYNNFCFGTHSEPPGILFQRLFDFL